jgi:hypothetical protein
MKKRYNSEDPDRLPDNLAELAPALKRRTYPLTIYINGPFWQLREWMGMENLCIAFIDRPEFVAEMIEFWTGFITRLLEKLLPHVQPDCVHYSEDMAYKAHPMIGPDMTREFILPSYLKWNGLCKQYGVPVIDMDSDGFVEDLVPVWIDGSINACDPMEVAAGNDINRFRKLFGRNMAYSGGIDKRAIAKGGKTLEEEIKRIESVVNPAVISPIATMAYPPMFLSTITAGLRPI